MHGYSKKEAFCRPGGGPHHKLSCQFDLELSSSTRVNIKAVLFPSAWSIVLGSEAQGLLQASEHVKPRPSPSLYDHSREVGQQEWELRPQSEGQDGDGDGRCILENPRQKR